MSLIDLLPAELVLAVLSHIDPLSKDPAAVRATCRSWRRFLRDERLWRQFHARVYPTRLPGDEATNEAHDALVMRGARSWRQSFADKTGRLKNALAHHQHRAKSKSDHEGLEWRLVAAANEGCLPLVRRFADALLELLASRGLEPAEGLASLEADNQRPNQRARGNVLHMALCGACVAHSAPTVKLLLELGAKVKPEKKYVRGDPKAPTGNHQYHAPLKCAAASHYVPLATLLLDHGADLEPTALAAAARVGDTAMIEMLLQRGVDHSDGSALWLAAHAGHMDAFRLLIDRGCDPRIGHALGNAVIARDVDAARLLTDHGAVPTSEHVAMALGHAGWASTVELLRVLASGIETNESYSLLTSAAVAAGDEDVCRFLIEHGVDINTHNDELPGRKIINTPLHHAARTNNVDHARCLLACGASTDVKHKETGVTAVSLARQYGHTEVARLIAKHRGSGAAKDKKKKEDEDEDEDESEAATKTSKSSGKRKNRSSSQSDMNEEEDDDDDDAKKQKKKAKTTKKTNKEKKEKEVSGERQEELALEADVRRLARLDKTDVFALRQLLRTAGMKPSEIPRRKVEMLRAAVARLTGDDADALLAKCRLPPNARNPSPARHVTEI